MTRTLIRSWPYRQQLPDGEEAEARAAKMAMFWRARSPAVAALNAAAAAERTQVRRRTPDLCAHWLPESVRYRS